MTTTTLLWLGAAVFAGFLTTKLIDLYIKYLRLRARELGRGHTALERYEMHCTRLLNDPATPKDVRQFIEMFAEGVGERSTAHYIARKIFLFGSWNRPKEDDDEPKVFAEMNSVKIHRPDLYDDFTSTIGMGFIYTMLRWPIPARAFSLIFTNPKRDPITPACAMVNAHDHHLDNDHAAAPA